MIGRYLTGRLRYCSPDRGQYPDRLRLRGKMSDVSMESPPSGYKEGPHPIISGHSVLFSLFIIHQHSDPLFSLIIFIYVSVIFLYMFFAFCWYDGMPIATFSSLPERTSRRRRRTYKRFVYPYPDDLHTQCIGNTNPALHNTTRAGKVSKNIISFDVVNLKQKSFSEHNSRAKSDKLII